MTDTTISNATVFPQDEGNGVSQGSEDYLSAGYLSMLAQAVSGTYVESGLDFTVDTGAESVDVSAGRAFVEVSSVSVQSASQSQYDLTLNSPVPVVVDVTAAETGLGLGTDTTNDVYLAVDTTQQDTAYIRHGPSVSAPSDPYVKLGTVNTNTGATTRPNDKSDLTTQSLSLKDFAELEPTNTPSSPSSGWRLFVDTNDADKLKAIDSAGNVTTIAS